jgi:hypothetical protein
MQRVTIDREFKKKLNGLDSEIEFCDESGQTVGRFVPEEEYMRLLYASIEIPFSEEEIEQAFNEGGGRPLKEILEDLNQT